MDDSCVYCLSTICTNVQTVTTDKAKTVGWGRFILDLMGV